MGFFGARKQRQSVATKTASVDHSHNQLVDRQQKVDTLTNMVDIVRDCRNGRTSRQFVDTNSYGFLLKKDEFPMAYLQVLFLENIVGLAGDATDHGNLLITNQRIMFAGDTRSHEWRLADMMNCSHLAGGSTIFAMTTGGQMTGFSYGEGSATEVQFRIELAIAMAFDSLERFEGKLQTELEQLELGASEAKPVDPAT